MVIRGSLALDVSPVLSLDVLLTQRMKKPEVVCVWGNVGVCVAVTVTVLVTKGKQGQQGFFVGLWDLSSRVCLLDSLRRVVKSREGFFSGFF